jgi:ribonucleoside-diphosphate reductase alpha chain
MAVTVAEPNIKPYPQVDRDGQPFPPISKNSLTVLERRYLLKDDEGRVIETPDEMFWRVAYKIAEAETRFEPTSPAAQEIHLSAEARRLLWARKFYQEMRSFRWLPNSPTLMNFGAPDRQQMGSACFVLPVGDSMGDIFSAVRNQALVHQLGGGTGFDFSDIRGKNQIVKSTKGRASGPISFMKVFNEGTETVKQGGTR